ncbi:MAG TPA: hypothetical protein VK034_24040 [Enhygromyxa sp.]|nr:hypothetical protein [Enhygromyxa sp.]
MSTNPQFVAGRLGDFPVAPFELEPGPGDPQRELLADLVEGAPHAG